MNTISFKQDPVEALLKAGLKHLWYPIGPSTFVGEPPVALPLPGAKRALRPRGRNGWRPGPVLPRGGW